ncbi:hypothetical protein ABTB97_21550, partial [Acinetobacter baumannii]
TACGGTMLFLIGTELFKRFASPHRNVPLSHLGGLAALVLLGAAGLVRNLPAQALGGALDALLLAVAIWEWRSFHGGWRRA